jgi:hypothetical protein
MVQGCKRRGEWIVRRTFRIGQEYRRRGIRNDVWVCSEHLKTCRRLFALACTKYALIGLVLFAALCVPYSVPQVLGGFHDEAFYSRGNVAGNLTLRVLGWSCIAFLGVAALIATVLAMRLSALPKQSCHITQAERPRGGSWRDTGWV